MKILLIFLVCLFSYAHGNVVAVTENDPSSIVNHVSVITGDLYYFQEDVVVAGVQPISFRRSYVSQKGFGCWTILDGLTATLLHSNIMIVKEPRGSFLHYMIKVKANKKNIEYFFDPLDANDKAKGLANTARGNISGLTNLKNQQLYLSSNQKEFSIKGADGIRRTYKRKHEEKMKAWGIEKQTHAIYILEKEEFPSGNKIIYEWPKKPTDVWLIRSCDPLEKTTYAWMKFYSKKGVEDCSDGDFGIETSDGRHLDYKFFYHNNLHLLKEVSSDEKPKETLHYLTWKDRKILNAITWPENRSIQFTYYMPGDRYQGSILQEDNPICFRVKQILSPRSDEGHLVITHTFEYDVRGKKTTVFDAYGTPTIYHWDEDLHLVEINRFTDKTTSFNTEKFIWGDKDSNDASNLIYKILLDAGKNPLRATKYSYDKYGNVKEETLSGNLTGSGKLYLDEKGLPTLQETESYSKQYKYSNDGKHLLLWKKEDNGSQAEYDYEGTLPLIKEERIFDRGALISSKHYTYSEYRILASEESTDHIQGTVLITSITPKRDSTYIGLPDVIETKYRGAHGVHLLKKVKLHYGDGGRVYKEEIFDSTGAFRYSLENHYVKGLLVKEVNAARQVAISEYDKLQNKKYYKDFGSRSECLLDYDSDNRLRSIEEKGEKLSRTIKDGYNFLNQKIRSCNEYGEETIYEYDPFGHRTKIILPGGESSYWRYGASGMETSHTDAKGYVTTTEYNAYDKPTLISYPDESYEYFTYYLDGTLKFHTDQRGNRTLYTYDSLGRVLSKQKEDLIETFTYNAFHLTSKTDPEGHTTFIGYDEAGRKISETLDNETVRYEYDSLGRQNKEIIGDLVTVTRFDALDRVTEVKKEDLKGNTLSKVTYGYDFAGNQSSITKYIQGKESLETFTYDALNRLICLADAYDKKTTYSYSLIPHEKITTDPLGLQVIETYNLNGKIQSLEKRSAAGKTLLMDVYAYDPNLNLECKVSHLEGRQVTTHWQYGPLNLLESLTEGVGTEEEKTTSYFYTPTGQLERLIKPNGITLTSTYDKHDFLESQFSSDVTVYYTYDYDKNGNLREGINPLTKEKITRTHDPKGRVRLETFSGHLYTEKDYDEQGRVKLLNLPNGDTIRYDYDALHLRSISRYFKDRCLYTHDYTSYDPLAGHLLEEKLPFNLGTVTRKYDLLERPVSFHSAFFSQQALEFDPVGNLLSTNRAGKFLTYTYDDLYQLTSEENHAYKFDALYNRVVKDQVSSSVNSLNQTSDLNYGKDGNPTFLKGKSLSYDALDRLITLEDGNSRICYSYDIFHRRLSKKTYGLFEGEWSLVDTLYYLYDDQNEIGAFDSSNKATQLRVLGSTSQAEIGSAIAIEVDQQIYIPFHDLHGNVAALYSPSDQKLEAYEYSAFGEEKFIPFIKNPWRFSSKRTDEETGLVYYGRRYYIPELGRWLSQDPLGYEAGPNLYAFVSNGPLTHFDLYGLLEDGWFARSMEKARDTLGAITHGTADFAVRSVDWTGSAFNHLGSSLLELNVSGRETSSIQWAASREKSLNVINTGITEAMSNLGVNTNSDLYQNVRNGTTMAWEGASCLIGAYGLTKTGMYACRKTAQYMGRGVASRSALWSSSAESATFGYPATSSKSAQLLKNRLVAEEIAGGHAFEKHVLTQGEFPGWIRTRKQFSQHIENVLNNPSEIKKLSGNRTIYWHNETGTTVLRNPSALDGGTTFQPKTGYKYFLKEKGVK